MSKELSAVNFNEEQVALIKSQIAPKATNDELSLFLYQAKRTGLDPLTRQIYAIHRSVKEKEFGKDVWRQKMSIQTSIDGFRVVAERSGSYGGQDEPIFDESNGLKSCKITVYRFRGDIRYPAAVGVAYWKEYCPKAGQDMMWQKMPHNMIAKVAEALALRKAYPQDLSGLYTGDEMIQVDITDANQEDEGNKNQFTKVANAVAGEMDKTFKEQAEKDFKRIKGELEICSNITQIEELSKTEQKAINNIGRHSKELLEKLKDCKQGMIEILETNLD